MEQDISKILEELSKIEKAADTYASDTEQAKQQLVAEQQKKKEAYTAELAAASQKRIEEQQAAEETAHKEALEKLRRDSDARFEAMDQSFAQHRHEWAQQIAAQIVGE